jgi:hypothetical protein
MCPSQPELQASKMFALAAQGAIGILLQKLLHQQCLTSTTVNLACGVYWYFELSTLRQLPGLEEHVLGHEF